MERRDGGGLDEGDASEGPVGAVYPGGVRISVTWQEDGIYAAHKWKQLTEQQETHGSLEEGETLLDGLI